jgi:hypothetical protein
MSTPVAETGFRRVLGLWDATCVVVGAIIGVGIFFNPRDVANVTAARARRSRRGGSAA